MVVFTSCVSLVRAGVTRGLRGGRLAVEDTRSGVRGGGEGREWHTVSAQPMQQRPATAAHNTPTLGSDTTLPRTICYSLHLTILLVGCGKAHENKREKERKAYVGVVQDP